MSYPIDRPDTSADVLNSRRINCSDDSGAAFRSYAFLSGARDSLVPGGYALYETWFQPMVPR